MTSVVDASIATKWFLDEAGSEAARAVIGDDDLIAPDLILSETYHAVWKRWRRGEALAAQVDAVIPRLQIILDRMEPTAAIAPAAGRLGIRLQHAIYDCLYLALAQRTTAVLLTADDRQYELARRLRIDARLV